MGKLFNHDGYLNIEHLDRPEAPFVIVVGARGVGKTYGLLKYYYERGQKVMYLRRTDTQAQIASTVQLNPYKSVMDDAGVEYKIGKARPKTVEVEGEVIAVICGLSTFSNLRGFDGSDIDAIVYDEFIPEQHERPIRDEAGVLWNAYETVNRNRELKGKPPLKLWMLANSNRIDSPIFADLGIMRKMMSLSKNENGIELDAERGILMVSINRSPISDKKEKTSLYKLANVDFKRMALQNDYRYTGENIRSFRLEQLVPKVQLGEITLYKHKESLVYYGTFHKSGSAPYYGTNDSEVERFLKRWGFLIEYYRMGYVMMESLDCDYIFRTLLKL